MVTAIIKPGETQLAIRRRPIYTSLLQERLEKLQSRRIATAHLTPPIATDLDKDPAGFSYFE